MFWSSLSGIFLCFGLVFFCIFLFWFSFCFNVLFVLEFFFFFVPVGILYLLSVAVVFSK